MERLYDTETILRSHGGDKEFVKYIASLFIQEVPKMSAELQKASLKKDWYNVHFYAHKMKATIDLFSINSLKDLIREVENQGKTATPSHTFNKDVEAVVKVIEDCTMQLKKEFSINNN